VRCTIAYVALVQLALSLQRRQRDELQTRRQVSEAILGLVR
jgi:hypothetical protein